MTPSPGRNPATAFAVTLALLGCPVVASAQVQYEIVHAFGGADGDMPWSGPIRGVDGALYGTTVKGGLLDLGTVYRLSAQGVLTTLHTFTGPDGAYPVAALLQGRDGTLYGTALYGGCEGRGTVFRISLLGFSVLHCFRAGEGRHPFAAVIQATDGLLYGTTVAGGANDLGTVFRLSPGGAFTTLHSFSATPSGGVSILPFGSLLQARDGHFYGTTNGSGRTHGSIYGMTRDGAFQTLAMLPGDVLGNEPPFTFGRAGALAGMREAADGTLYGITCCIAPPASFDLGKIVTLTGSGLAVVHAFSLENGFAPVNPPIVASDGNAYGATSRITGGTGSLYRLTPGGEFTTLKVFAEADGVEPVGALLEQPDGLYGTALSGGPGGHGVIFRLRVR